MEVPSITAYGFTSPNRSGTVETIPTPGAAHVISPPKELKFATNR